MRVVLIVAAARNGVIGREGRIPWRIPEDLKRFKRLTLGHPVVMGRKTWESLGRPLPGRENVVVTRNPDYRAEGARVVHTLRAALDLAAASGSDETFVIGGGELYREALPIAHRLEVTHVALDVEGDATFPAIDASRWREVAREEHEQTEPQPARYAFVTYERRA